MPCQRSKFTTGVFCVQVAAARTAMKTLSPQLLSANKDSSGSELEAPQSEVVLHHCASHGPGTMTNVPQACIPILTLTYSLILVLIITLTCS